MGMGMPVREVIVAIYQLVLRQHVQANQHVLAMALVLGPQHIDVIVKLVGVAQTVH